MLGQTGGHGDCFLPSGHDSPLRTPYPGFPDGVVDGVDQARKVVRELVRARADWIKIASTGGVLSDTDLDRRQLRDDELHEIVTEAAAAGLDVMSHAMAADGVKAAIRNGVRSIEHGVFLDDEAIEMMVERGTWLVPTLDRPARGAAGGLGRARRAAARGRGQGARGRRGPRRLVPPGCRGRREGSRWAPTPGSARTARTSRSWGDGAAGLRPLDAFGRRPAEPLGCCGWSTTSASCARANLADLLLVHYLPEGLVGLEPAGLHRDPGGHVVHRRACMRAGGRHGQLSRGRRVSSVARWPRRSATTSR